MNEELITKEQFDKGIELVKVAQASSGTVFKKTALPNALSSQLILTELRGLRTDLQEFMKVLKKTLKASTPKRKPRKKKLVDGDKNDAEKTLSTE